MNPTKKVSLYTFKINIHCKEILEYAKYLGMDLKKDKKYFYIAREGLKAPLPDKWKPYKNSKGEIYYINMDTKQAVFEHPCDDHYRKLFQKTKAKEALAEKNKANLKIVTKTQQKPDFFFQKPLKTQSHNDILNQFQMLNDSFSDNSGKMTEKSSAYEFENVSEQELGQIDLETNNKLIEYQKMKEIAFKEFLNNLEKNKKEKEKSANEKKNAALDLLKQELKTLEEKMQGEKKKMEESFIIGSQIKIQQRLKGENEKIISRKKKIEENLKISNKETIKNYEEELKREINQKKLKIYSLKNEEEKNLGMKKRILENKKKLLLSKLNEEFKRELEKQFLDNFNKFQEEETENKKQQINDFKINLEEENKLSLYVIFFLPSTIFFFFF